MVECLNTTLYLRSKFKIILAIIIKFDWVCGSAFAFYFDPDRCIGARILLLPGFYFDSVFWRRKLNVKSEMDPLLVILSLN